VFERYTEKARLVIFFARFQATRSGSPCIETEHLLLGLLHESHETMRLLPRDSEESIRKQIDARTNVPPGASTSVDLPLSNESKRALAYAAEEAERLAHRHIGAEHLLLGLLREQRCFAAEILRERGVSLEKLREHFAKVSTAEAGAVPRFRPHDVRVEIHGLAWHADTIRERVKILRQFNWHWQKQPWTALDLAVGNDGKISFDTRLAKNVKGFNLHQTAWKKEQCPICNWELFESENQPQHSIGYTNGRDWVCTECYEKFLQGPDYFATTHPEIT